MAFCHLPSAVLAFGTDRLLKVFVLLFPFLRLFFFSEYPEKTAARPRRSFLSVKGWLQQREEPQRADTPAFIFLFGFFFVSQVAWVWASHFISSPPPPPQQSAHAKESMEQVEVAILKTCQSISELRREVSTRLGSPVTNVSGPSFAFPHHSPTSPVTSPSLLHLCLCSSPSPPFFTLCPSLLPLNSLFLCSRSSIRWRSVAPPTC